MIIIILCYIFGVAILLFFRKKFLKIKWKKTILTILLAAPYYFIISSSYTFYIFTMGLGRILTRVFSMGDTGRIAAMMAKIEGGLDMCMPSNGVFSLTTISMCYGVVVAYYLVLIAPLLISYFIAYLITRNSRISSSQAGSNVVA
jgi:hypothetical protein